MPTQPGQAKVPAWKTCFNRSARDPAVARLRGQVETLLTDLDIVILMEHGDADGAAIELVRRRKEADARQKEAIDFILTHRRLLDAGETFAPPRNFRLLGTGTHLHAPCDYDPADKTFLATRRLTVLGLPLMDLGAYRATLDDKGRFKPLSRVPLEPHVLAGRRVKKRVAAGLLVLLALAGLFFARPDMVAFQSLPSAVHVINGLEFPVSVTIGEEKIEVPALGQVSHPIGKGYWHLVSRFPNGEIMEEENIENQSGEGVFTYNILGVAPLYSETIAYTSGGVTQSDETLMALERTVRLEDVNGVLTPAPRQVRVPFWKESVSRRFVQVFPGGWRTTVARLEDPNERWTVITRTLVADPKNEAAYRAGVDALFGMEPKAAIQAARTFYSGHWESINAQRLLMWTMIRAAGREGAIDAYQTLQVIEPKTAIGALLTAQVSTPDKAVALLEPAVNLYSSEYFLRLNLARALHLQRRFEAAAAHYATLVEQDARAIRSCYREYGLSQLALGRAADAVRTVARAGDLEGFPADFAFAVFYARLAEKVSVSLRPHPVDHYLERTPLYTQDPQFARAFFRSITSGVVPEETVLAGLTSDDERNLVRLVGTMDDDVSAALALVRDMSLEALERLDNVRLILLAGEFNRRGDTDDAKSLIDLLHLWAPWQDPVVAALQEGVVQPEVAELDLELQAALKLVHARRLGTAAKDHRQLIEEAARLDVAGGIVSAAASWELSPPASGSTPAARKKP